MSGTINRKRPHKYRKTKYHIEPKQKIGLWTVIEMAEPQTNGGKAWKVQCDCGTLKILPHYSLGSGKTLSCGCQRSEYARLTKTTHGDSTSVDGKTVCTTEYLAWQAMIARCHKTYSASYKYHGARGITVCERWLESYENFLEDVGRKPYPDWSLDRIDNDGNYEPSNVRWTDRKTQARNTRHNRHLTVGNETLTLVEWCERTGVSPSTLWQRLRMGWPPEKAILNRRFHKNDRGKDFSLQVGS